MKKRLIPLLAGLVGLVGFVALPAARAQSTDATITALGLNYVPPVVVVHTGDGAVLDNKDPVTHDVQSRDGLFHSGSVSGGTSGPVLGVDKLPPGEYAYYCSFHSWMNGVLVIEDQVPTPPTPVAPGVGTIPAAGAVAAPTSITVHDGSLYAASYVQGAVEQLPILAGGALGPATTYASGFTNPLGIAFGSDGTLFVSDSHTSTTPGRLTDGRVWAVPPGGGTPTVVIDGLPNGRHNTNGMAVFNGRLYITNGSSTDDGVSGGPPEVPPWTGSVLSVPEGDRNLTLTSPDVTVVLKGGRNLYDIVFRPGTSEAWVPMNGPDMFDPYGEDLLLKADVTQPAPDFGFPECLYGPGGVNDWISNTVVSSTNPCTGAQKLPEQIMGLHVSADGAAFGVAPFDPNSLYVALFGNFFGSKVVGHQVVRVPIDPVTGKAGPLQTVFAGGLPLDIAFGPDGTMYVADFAAGIEVVKHL